MFVYILLCIILFTISYWILSKPSSSEDRKTPTTVKPVQSFDDGLLSERRLRPVYNKISNKVGQSFKWLKNKAKNKFASSGRTRGDGLNSIFSETNVLEGPSPVQSNLDAAIASVRSEILDAHQEFAFASLFKWGIFEGAELSILNDLCSNATLVSRKKGDMIVAENDTKSELLYVIKSGSCEISFLMPNGSRESVYELSEGSVVASVVDVISWIIRSDVRREIAVRCACDCELVAIPSPRDEKGRFQSRLHATSFARIVRMLLIRFNRTTITTALFYLGLAEHFIPSFPRIPIPEELVELCKSSSCGGRSRVGSEDELLMSDVSHSRSVLLVREAIAGLLGVDASDINLPQSSTSACSHSSSSGLRHDEEEELEDGDRESTLSIPPPIAITRALSFDSTMAQGGDTTQRISQDSYYFSHAPRGQGRSKSGLCMMAAGQSILDVDPVPGLYVIVSGRIQIQFLGTNNLKRMSNLHKPRRNVAPVQALLSQTSTGATAILSEGEVIGQIALLAGTSSEWYGRRDGSAPPVMSVIALEDSFLLRVPVKSYEKALAAHPQVIFHLSSRILSALPPIIRLFDLCTKWVRLNGGDDIVTRGQGATGELYIVLCGRLRVVIRRGEEDGHESDLREAYPRTDGGYLGRTGDWVIGRGTLIGDTELLTGEPFRHTVRAIRQTALSRVPVKLLDFLSRNYPIILTYIVKNVSDKQAAALSSTISPSMHQTSGGIDVVSSKTIMVCPISGSVPLDLVCSTLRICLERCVRKALLVTSSDAAAVFGGVLDGLSEYELVLTVGSWMHQMELDYDIVIYQADWTHSAWNRLCVTQCDEILLVANALDDPEIIYPLEECLHTESKLIPKTLVMLFVNPAEDAHPSGTRKWIERREGVERHVHVRLHTSNQRFDTHHYRSDFNRLARILTDTAVGVVLGGGGARGISHIGVLQALEERGIPVDMIGGTSIGSFIGGLYSCEQSVLKVNPIAKSWASKLASLWFYFEDLTFPVTSYFNGYNFSRAIRHVFSGRKIEDFWLNYFCVTTDLTSHTERIHVNGTASRYIRASMSLANFLPPLCDVDPRDSSCHYLVDGGYVNTVPVDIMKYRFGARVIIAVDVSGEWSLAATHNYGDFLSGASVLLSRWNPFSQAQNVRRYHYMPKIYRVLYHDLHFHIA